MLIFNENTTGDEVKDKYYKSYTELGFSEIDAKEKAESDFKKHKEMINSIKPGHKILTAGGLYGTVTGVAEKAVTVEIANNVKVKVAKSYIVAVMTNEFEVDE